MGSVKKYLGLLVSICFILNLHATLATDDEDVFFPYNGRYEAFDLEILKKLDSADLGNVVISPLSLKLLLAVLYEGVAPKSATAKEMEILLDFPSNITAVKEKFTTIVKSLKSSYGNYDLNIKSRVYLDSGYSFQETYPNRIMRIYEAESEQVDFKDAAKSVQKINDWINNATNGKITDLVSEGDVSESVLLLLNAIYFKGKWLFQFPSNQTTKGGFYLSPHQSVTCEYMSNTGKYYYVESNELDAKIIRLPYQGSSLAMFIILPNSKAGLQRVIKNLNFPIMKKNYWFMDKVNVEVILPKFKFEYKSKFGRILQQLGLQKIFDNTAHFGRLVKGSKNRVFVSNIVQKAGIEITEEGTTAYATSEIILGNKFGVPDYIFNASNPFMFYIEDSKTGALLFAGKIENPVQAEVTPFPADLELPSRFGPPAVIPLTIPNPTHQMNLNPSDQTNLLNYRKFHYFDLEFFKAVATRSNENVLISPVSVKMVLAMILEGAAGQSAEELINALRLPHDHKEIRQLFSNILNQFADNDPGVEFEIANQIFISDQVTPYPQYQEILQRYFSSGVKALDFRKPAQSAKQINDWVHSATHGLIPTLLSADSIRQETSVILANALYFKGIWEKSFNADTTRKSCFIQNSNQECYSTYMMESTDTYNYAELKELDAKALELLYKDGRFSMLLLLPNRINGLSRMLRDLPYEYEHILKSMEKTEVSVSIPRFDFEYSEDVVRHLEEVKITEIFSELKANLSNMVTGKNNLFISNVFHKTKIEVNEKGTIAAASTGAVVIPLMGSTKPRFRADHPFLFFIRDLELGIVLFAGRVVEPERADVSPPQNEGYRGKQYTQDSYTSQDSRQPQYMPQPPQQFAPQVSPQYISQGSQNPQYNPQNSQSNPVQYQTNQRPQYIQNKREQQYETYQQNENGGITFPKKN